MIEGLWIVYAEGPQGNSTGGVAIFTNGKIYGGDSGFYYVGTYHGDAVVKARVAVHQFDPAVPNILGVGGDYELNVTAMVDGDTMNGTAVVASLPNEQMAIKLVRKASI